MPSPAKERPAALLVTRNFPPLVGGMENVNRRLLLELAALGPVDLCGPAGCGAHAPKAARVAESPLRPLWRFLAGAGLRCTWMALRGRPKLILAGSGLTAPLAWFAARLCGARAAVYLHGLDIIVPNRLYQTAWLPFLRRCELVLVNSANTARLARAAGIPAARIAVLHPGTDVPAADPGARARFRALHGLPEQRILLSVGRLTRRKGLAEFVARSLPALVGADASIMLVVIGEEATDALHGTSGSERQRILECAREHGVSAHVRLAGRCGQAALADAYQGADLHVFPVLDLPGDVEGFGMVALESAAHGLRTAAFDVGGIPDAMDPATTGALVASGDYQALTTTVLALLASPPGQAQQDACRRFAASKDWRHFGERLRAIVAQGADRA